MPEGDRELLRGQLAYYEARAPEYDDWFFRRGRYDRGPAATERWFAEVEEARRALARVDWRGRHILELAPGTGLWTAWLLDQGARVTAVEGSPAMVEVLRARVGDAVEVRVADLFEWTPDRPYDGVFFGFFLSHVPRERLEPFWHLVGAARGDGPVGFIDSLRSESSTAADHVLPEGDVMTRRLNDGREFEIVKTFLTPGEVAADAARAGLTVAVMATPTYFLYGTGG